MNNDNFDAIDDLSKKDLPRMTNLEEKSPEFDERKEETNEGRRTLWIIILAFMLLASIGVIVWLVFSGREDQMIHGDNLPALIGEPQQDEASVTSVDGIDPGVNVVSHDIDLTDYDSNITLTEAGEYNLKGILNYSVLVKADAEVTLNLNGVTIAATKTSAIANQTENPLVIALGEDKTNTLTDGGKSAYDGVLFSKGILTIRNAGSADGKLIVSGRQTGGEGIATENADILIESGKIMVSSNDDGINCGGDAAGNLIVNGGTLWVKAGGDGLDSNAGIEINDGLLYIMGSETNGDAAIDSDDGFTINGGTIVALGSAMLEKPLTSSKQKSLAITFNETVAEGSDLIIRNKDTGSSRKLERVESGFKTLIYSAKDLTSGTYEILVNSLVVGTGTVE